MLLIFWLGYTSDFAASVLGNIPSPSSGNGNKDLNEEEGAICSWLFPASGKLFPVLQHECGVGHFEKILGWTGHQPDPVQLSMFAILLVSDSFTFLEKNAQIFW